MGIDLAGRSRSANENDIPLLVEYFVGRFVKGFTSRSLLLIVRHFAEPAAWFQP